MPTNDKEPTLLVTVSFEGSVSGATISKTYQIPKSEINDIDWFGGDCGDSFFDDMEDDGERFEQRIEDSLRGMMYWDSDPETGGEDEEFIGYHDALDYEVDLNGFREEDFYPSSN